MNFVKTILLIEEGEAFSKTTGEVPAVLLEVLGKSTLQRTLESLAECGMGEVVIVAGKKLAGTRLMREQAGSTQVTACDPAMLWKTAEQLFVPLTENATHIFLINLNAYTELNWEDVVQHHRQHGNKITCVTQGEGEAAEPLGICLVSASRRNDTAFLLRSGLRNSRTGCVPYGLNRNGNEPEYVNLLRHELDLRRLAADALHRGCRMQPIGREVRPGIWVGENARIDKRARLVAPVFIGRRTKIRSGAVITRGSSIEHHAVVGDRTVVENGTVLPYTNLGPGLDVSHSLIGERHIFNLQRNACTPIQDPRLVGQTSASAGVRSLASMAKLLSYVPGQMWRGIRGKDPKPAAEASVGYKDVISSAKKKPAEAAKVSAGLAVVRRYGNQ